LFVLIALLGLALGAMLWAIARLPVPERFTLAHVSLVLSAMLASAAVTAVPMLRGIGILLLTFALLGFALVLAPPSWKMNAKLALRNIGRTRARTATTMLALLVGVFAVGLILVLGQDLKESLGGTIASQFDYNVVAIIPLGEKAELEQQLRSLPGLSSQQTTNFAAANAIAIDGRSAAERITDVAPGATFRTRRQLRLLAGIQGYDLSAGHLPGIVQVTSGRALGPADAGSVNVLVEDSLRQPPLALREADTVTLKQAGGNATQTLTVVGFYRLAGGLAGGNFNLAPIFGSDTAAQALAGNNPFAVFYLNVNPARISAAVGTLQNESPDAVVVNLDDVLVQFERVLNNILVLLTAIASLALSAGFMILANAVALAMLERRRELGILKALGYTGSRVLTGVLLENALTAGLGGVLGMAPVSLAIVIFNRQAGVSFGVPAGLVIAIVLAVVALTAVATTVVAWSAIRVRPLAVLRYE
jgi:putative ABC transport system permease protein